MSSLKDLHFAMNGETQKTLEKYGKDISGLVHYDPANPPKIDDENEWIIFKLVDNSKNGGVYINGVDDVINPATGKVERIRLLSGVDTIWLKEQKDITKEYADRNLREISFPRGVKIRRVRKIDRTMIDFLRICNANVGNKNRIKASRFEIYEYDSATADKEAFAKEEFELDMALIAKQAKSEPMRKHAAFLGIRLINDIGEKKSDDGVRREYVMYAKRNPKYFKDTMESPQIEVSWLVRKGISESLIEIGREPGKIFWANGGGMIGVIPQGVNPQEYLTELAMTNSPEGLKFKEELKKVIT